VNYCPNGTPLKPSHTIAEKFKIPWRRANADIVAGLAAFDPKGLIAATCAEFATHDPIEQRVQDARLVLCDAVDHEMDLTSRGEHAKNALVLADQGSPGGRTVGLSAILHEYQAYLRGEWQDADCTALYAAAGAASEFGDGHSMNLTEGAIGRGVEFNAVSFEKDKKLAGPDLPE
jgi:hypothetical protein